MTEIHVKSILAWVSERFELARVRVIGSQLYMYWKVRIKFNDSSYSLHVGCATDETKLWLSPPAKQCRNPCSGYPPVYQDLSMRHDWPVKKAIVDFQTGWKEIQNAFLVIHWVRIWVCAMIGLWRKPILITLSLDNVWILLGENYFWSPLALKGLV